MVRAAALGAQTVTPVPDLRLTRALTPKMKARSHNKGSYFMTKTVMATALAVALMITSAQAQGGGMGGGGGRHQKQQKTDKSASPASKADEKAYNAALKLIPDKKPADPWGNMR